MSRSLLYLGAFAGALLGTAPRSARACTGCDMRTRLDSVTLRPASGQTAVPTNTRVWVDYETTGAIPVGTGRLSLRPERGASVEAEVQQLPAVSRLGGCQARLLMTLRPLAPLMPDTNYEILDQIATVPCLEKTCDSGGPRVLGNFTTGSGADAQPPRFEGVTRSQGGSAECDQGSCCGPYRAATFDLEADPATDDSGVALYEVSLDGQVVDALTLWPSLSGYVLCSTEAVAGPPRPQRPGGRYRFNAVDLAGNRDSNSRAISVSPSCGGCSYGGGRTHGPLGLAVLALLLVCRRPRRYAGRP